MQPLADARKYTKGTVAKLLEQHGGRVEVNFLHSYSIIFCALGFINAAVSKFLSHALCIVAGDVNDNSSLLAR